MFDVGGRGEDDFAGSELHAFKLDLRDRFEDEREFSILEVPQMPTQVETPKGQTPDVRGPANEVEDVVGFLDVFKGADDVIPRRTCRTEFQVDRANEGEEGGASVERLEEEAACGGMPASLEDAVEDAIGASVPQMRDGGGGEEGGAVEGVEGEDGGEDFGREVERDGDVFREP